MMFPMSSLVRIGVALDESLLELFDRLLEQSGYHNRSEAFRDLIRDRLARASAEDPAREVVGSLTLVYDHHQRQLNDRLVELQHRFHHTIISTLHVHLDHDNCLEVLILRGLSADVRKVADALISVKGVKHGQLSMTTADVDKPHSH
jgi:CopG family nickel-responsive transcriptional regulator